MVDYSGCLTHISGHPSATGRAQDSESSPAKDRRSTTVPHNLQISEGAEAVSTQKISSVSLFDHIFVYFRPVVSSFFFSSPILSRHRFDVYHTSTYDVVLVRI